MDNYEEALKYYIPRRKECDIRVNYALSICETVELDETNQESIEEAIQKYERAIDILVEEKCAHRNNEKGHDKEAQELKDDIQKEIERLKKLLEEATESKDSKDDDKEDKPEKEKEDTLEEKIQEIKAEAIKEQRGKEEIYKGLNRKYTDVKKRW